MKQIQRGFITNYSGNFAFVSLPYRIEANFIPNWSRTRISSDFYLDLNSNLGSVRFDSREARFGSSSFRFDSKNETRFDSLFVATQIRNSCNITNYNSIFLVFFAILITTIGVHNWKYERSRSIFIDI